MYGVVKPTYKYEVKFLPRAQIYIGIFASCMILYVFIIEPPFESNQLSWAPSFEILLHRMLPQTIVMHVINGNSPTLLDTSIWTSTSLFSNLNGILSSRPSSKRPDVPIIRVTVVRGFILGMRIFGSYLPPIFFCLCISISALYVVSIQRKMGVVPTSYLFHQMI